MGKRPKTNELNSLINEAIVSAHDQYRKMSNGAWLWSGAEYFLTVSIAKRLRKKLKPEFCTMVEEPLTGGEITFSRGAKAEVLRHRGRIDCVLLTENWTPVCAIEVKSMQHPGACKADVERLTALIRQSAGKFPTNFAYYASNEGPKSLSWLQTRADALTSMIDDILAEQKNRKAKIVRSEPLVAIKGDDVGNNDAFLAYSVMFETHSGYRS